MRGWDAVKGWDQWGDRECCEGWGCEELQAPLFLRVVPTAFPLLFCILGVDFKVKKMVVDGHTVQLAIWVGLVWGRCGNVEISCRGCAANSLCAILDAQQMLYFGCFKLLVLCLQRVKTGKSECRVCSDLPVMLLKH